MAHYSGFAPDKEHVHPFSAVMALISFLLAYVTLHVFRLLIPVLVKDESGMIGRAVLLLLSLILVAYFYHISEWKTREPGYL